MALSPQEILAARNAGYTGEFGAGAFKQFLASNPQNQANYTSQYKQIMNGTPAPSYNGGVVPIGQVEPFNDYQKTGLQNLAGGFSQYGQPYFSQAAGALNNVQGLVNQGTQGLTDQDFSGMISRFMNPYQSQVVDSTVGTLTDAATQAKARLNAAQAGRRSFGDSSSAMQSSEVDKNLLKTIGDTVGGLNYSGFNNAVTSGLSQFNQDRNRQLAGTTPLMNLGTQFQGLGQNAMDNARNDTLDKLKAGTAIQQQNQSLLDVARGEINRVNNFDQNQLAMLGQMLGLFPGGGSETKSPYNPNLMQNIGGLGMSAAGLGMESNGLKWSDIFN